MLVVAGVSIVAVVILVEAGVVVPGGMVVEIEIVESGVVIPGGIEVRGGILLGVVGDVLG